MNHGPKLIGRAVGFLFGAALSLGGLAIASDLGQKTEFENCGSTATRVSPAPAVADPVPAPSTSPSGTAEGN